MEFENTSLLEGLRLLLGCIGFGVSLWGLIHAEDGQFAFARPIRRDVIRDRKAGMAGLLLVHTLLGFQAVLVANTPDAAVPSLATTTGNITLIFSLLILSLIAARRISSWGRQEEIIGSQPLSPTDAERLKETARMGRPMIHVLQNDLHFASGALEALMLEAHLTAEQEEELETAVERLGYAGRQLAALQQMVRGLGLTDEPRAPSDPPGPPPAPPTPPPHPEAP